MQFSLMFNFHQPIRLLVRFNALKVDTKSVKKSFVRSFNISCAKRQQPEKREKSTITLNIFDRKAKLLQRERAALSEEVHNFDYLKNEIGYRLADRIFDIKRKFKTVINLGCGRGFISKHISSDSVENLILTDSSELLVSQAVCEDPKVQVQRMVCDEEHLDEVFKAESAEMIISNLTLHWVNNLPGCFKQVFNILKVDGAFLGSMFGIDTLYELRSSLQLAELERKGGISPHVSPFTKPMDIGHLLMTSGFTMQTIDVDELVVRYPTMFELLHDLKGMGENNASWNRSLHISRDTLLAASVIYKQLYENTKLDEKKINGIPATFQIIYFIGWKPDPTKPQPQPKNPSMVSLKDYYNIHELGVEEPKKIKLDD